MSRPRWHRRDSGGRFGAFQQLAGYAANTSRMTAWGQSPNTSLDVPRPVQSGADIGPLEIHWSSCDIGERRRHARFVADRSSLPYDLAVEIEGMFEIG